MTYTVKSGDSLSLIAKNVLGNMQRWPEIARLNGLTAPYTLRVGQTLQIPTAPSAQSDPIPPPTRDVRDASARLAQLQGQLTELAGRMRVALAKQDLTTLETLRKEYRAISGEAAILRQQINRSEAPPALLQQLDTFSDRVLAVGSALGEIPSGIASAFKYLPVILGAVAVVAVVLAIFYLKPGRAR